MSNSNQWVTALNGIIGEPNVIRDPDQLKAYAVDGLAPKAVVIPGSVDEVSRLLAYAFLEKLAVVPRGNGTKMAAGGIPGCGPAQPIKAQVGNDRTREPGRGP